MMRNYFGDGLNAEGNTLRAFDVFDEAVVKNLPDEVQVFDTLLEPGDTIYIPTGAAHGAKNLATPTIAMTANYVDQEHREQVSQLYCEKFAAREIPTNDPMCLQVTGAVDEMPFMSFLESGKGLPISAEKWISTYDIACAKFRPESGHGYGLQCPQLEKACKKTDIQLSRASQSQSLAHRIAAKIRHATIASKYGASTYSEISKFIHQKNLETLSPPPKNNVPPPENKLIQINLKNGCQGQLHLFWVEASGDGSSVKEPEITPLAKLDVGEEYEDGSYAGHIYRARTLNGQIFDYLVNQANTRHVFRCDKQEPNEL